MFCSACCLPLNQGAYITTKIIETPTNSNYTKGPLSVYMGSMTQDSTSLLKPWEKPSKIPVVRKALKLRSLIGWFITPKDSLAISILKKTKEISGEKDLKFSEGFSQTGSALHRFSSACYSSGGFCSSSHNLLIYTFIPTDTLLGSLVKDGKNWDFMFQSLLLWCQGIVL